MFMQSVMMGYGFGTGFQYSKRKISAMSNEEFNATSIVQETQKMFESYKLIIPELKQSIDDSKDLQSYVLAAMIDMPRNLLADLFGAVAPAPVDSPDSGGSVTDPVDKTAADVFKETEPVPETQDFAWQTNYSGAIHDKMVPVSDYYKKLVYNLLWVKLIKVSGTWDEYVTKLFFTTFSTTLVKTLNVKKVEEVKRQVVVEGGFNQIYIQMKIYYHL